MTNVRNGLKAAHKAKALATTAQEATPQRAVQSAEVGGHLLLALADAQRALPLKELAALASLSASRAHPYLVSLQRLGLVEQQATSGHYALGPAALRVGLSALHQLDPLRDAEAAAEALAADTGHSVALAVWGSFGPTVVRLLEARRALHVSLRVGHVMALADTATGRAFAATLPMTRLQDALQSSASAHPGLEDHKELLALRERCAKEWQQHGLLRASGRPIPGVNAFSAPVLDHQGDTRLVITVLDHEARLPTAYNCPAAQRLAQTAKALGQRWGAGDKR